MRRKLLANRVLPPIFFVSTLVVVLLTLLGRGRKREVGVQKNSVTTVGRTDSHSAQSLAGQRAADSYKRRVERGKSDKIYISVRPKGDFLDEIPQDMTRVKGPHKFETHDVGRKGHSMRIAGVVRDGRAWKAKTWVLAKEDFRVGKHGEIIPRNARARRLLTNLIHQHGAIIPVQGDTFRFEGMET